MIRIVHTGDLHLDSPFSMLDLQKSEVRRHELRDSFRELIELVTSTKTDLLLIAGDLFDTDYLTRETAEMIVSAFKKIPSTRVLIAPGNHDPYSVSGIYSKLKFSDNVFIFKDTNVTYFDFPEINCSVYGYAFTGNEFFSRPLCACTPKNKSRINIMLAHGDTTSATSKYAPITETDIENSCFDYIALGHIHNTTGLKQTKNGTHYGYCGCFEGRGFDEIGEKGVYTALLDKQDGKLSFNHRFIPFSKRIYEKHKLNITDVTSTAALITKIKDFISASGYDKRYALEIELVGTLSTTVKIFPQYIREKITELFAIKITDSTEVLCELENLKNDLSLKGALYEKLRPMLESDDREKQEIAALALKYGICAITGGEVSDIF